MNKPGSVGKFICLVTCTAAMAIGLPVTSRASHDNKPVQQNAWETACRHKLPTTGPFSPQEHRAWEDRICLGREANLSEFGASAAKECDPANADKWPAARTLSPVFLHTILFNKPLRDALPVPEVHISCAHFKVPLNLSNYILKPELWLDNSRFDGQVDLSELRGEQAITFDDSVLAGGLLGKNLHLNADLRLRRAQVEDLSLPGAHIAGMLNLASARLKKLYAPSVVFGHSLYMNAKARFGGVNLQNAKIGDDLAVNTANASGRFDLMGATIGGELILNLSDQPPGGITWEKAASIILQDTKAGTLNDSRTAWYLKHRPGEFIPIDIKGFTYERLGGFGEGDSENMAQRDVEWLLTWLSAQTNTQRLYNPQPYRQLAKVVREQGFISKSDEILYAMRDQQRNAGNISSTRKFWLTLQWLFIGYGHDNLRSLVPFSAMVLPGFWLCRFASETHTLSPAGRFWFSLDRALPFVELGPARDVTAPENWVGSYFYVHTILGFILASFLFAGLTGFVG